MSRNQRLKRLYELAVEHGLVKTQKEFAQFIEIDNSSLTHALKDDGRISLSNTIKKAEHALMKEGVSIDGGEITGDGNMQNVNGSNNTVGVPPKKFTHEDEWFALVKEKDRQIERLLTIIENMQKGK